MQIKEFDWSRCKKPVVIYGATVGGKIIHQCLKKYNIKVKCFCDRKEIEGNFEGCPVVSPETLKQENSDVAILIALTRSFESAAMFLADNGDFDVYRCVDLLKGEGLENFIFEESEKELARDFFVKYPIYAKNLDGGKICLPSLEVFITERCTLRCRDCSHLIPRYKRPKDYSIDMIIKHIENVLKIVERVEDLIILGGEPFLHDELYKLIEWASNDKKIGIITIITNGSILPQNELFSVMEGKNIRIRLSNYGKYSIQIKSVQAECEKRKISCYINDEKWTDMGPIRSHKYSKKDLMEVFGDCPFAFSILLLNGHLYRCAHVAHMNNLEIIDSKMHDSVNVMDISEDMILQKKNELREYLQVLYLEGCIYCNGIRNSIQGIEPAIQGER